MAQWLRIHLPVQRAQILSLVGERAHMSWGNEVWTPQLLKPSCLEAMLHKRSHPVGSLGTALTVTSTQCNQRKPACIKEDSAQPHTNNKK